MRVDCVTPCHISLSAPENRLTTRSDPGASDTPHQHEKRLELFFLFFLLDHTHTQREKLSSSRMYVIYREKKNKTDSSAPSVSLIVNLARSWIFFFNFVQIQNDFPRKCIFKKHLVESIQERKKMAYRCVRENLFKPWITSYMMDVIQLTSLRNMNSIFFFSRPTCKVMSLKSFFFGKSFKLIISREMTHFLVCCGYVGGPRASQPPFALYSSSSVIRFL